MSLLLQGGTLGCKSILPSPPCRVLHNGVVGLNVMTAISEAHTHACTQTHTHTRYTHTLPNHIISAAPLIPPFFLSSFLCILLTQSHPRTFLPCFCLSLFPDVFSHSNPSLAFLSFFLFFYYDKGAAPRTGSRWRPWQQPPPVRPPPSPLIKAFPEPQPTPLTHWLPFIC